MKNYYIYGTKEINFNSLQEDLALLFKCTLNEHDSSWWGIYAKGATKENLNIKLYPNFVEGEGHHVENKNFNYLLEIISTETSNIASNSKYSYQLISHKKL